MAKDEKKPMGERYLEDFLVGQTFVSGRVRNPFRRRVCCDVNPDEVSAV
jgi:hypothetical protein